MNRLQRAGVVASVVWFFAGGIWFANNESKKATDFAAVMPRICEQNRDQERSWSTPDHCWDTFRRDFNVMDPHPLGGALIAGLLPIPFAWLIVFALIRTGRWVIHGRWKRRK